MNNFLPAIKKVIAAYNQTSLILRILIGLIIGALIGLFIPSMKWMAEFGTLFVGALRSIAPILVFVIVSSALCQNSARLDKRFGRVIFSLYADDLWRSSSCGHHQQDVSTDSRFRRKRQC